MSKAEKLSLAVVYFCYALVFLPLLDAGFIWDDADHFVHDHLQLIEGGLYKIWFAPEPGVWNYWPLSRTSFWLEHRLWGASPLAAHLINWILHGLSGLMFFLVLKQQQFRYAILATVVFLLHPAVVESFAWITERKNVLSMFLAMGSAWCFSSLLQNNSKRLAVACVLLFALALLAKTSVISLPVFMLMMAWQHGQLTNKYLQAVILALFLVGAVAALLSFHFEAHYIGSSLAIFDLGVAEKLAVVGKVYLFYLSLFFYPGQVNFLYPRFDWQQPGFLDFMPLFTIALMFVLSLALWRKKQQPVALIFMLAYLAILFPVSGLFRVYGMRFSFVSDHWFYPAIVPLAVLMAMILGFICDKLQARYKPLILIGLLVFYTPQSLLHAGDFKNLKTLWSVTVNKNPDAFLAHTGLCQIYIEEQYLEGAKYHCNEALRSGDKFKETELNLALLAGMSGNYDEAIKKLEIVVAENPAYSKAILALAETLFKQGRINEAFVQFDLAIERSPEYEEAYLVRGLYLELLGRKQAAMENYKQGVQHLPYSMSLQNKLRDVE